MNGLSPQICVVDFPWITLPKGRRVLKDGICPRKVVVCHLPFVEDDINNYRAAAANALQQLERVYLLQDPLQTIEI